MALSLGLATLALIFYFGVDRSPPGWQHDYLVDHSTDDTTLRYRLEAENGGGRLYMLCKPNRPVEAILVADRPLGTSGRAQHRVNMRFDEGASVEGLFGVVGDTINFTEAADRAATDFIAQLAASRWLALDMTPPAGEGTPLTTTFATTGADDVLVELREVCT